MPGGPGGGGLGPPGQGTSLLSAAGPRARGERVCTDSPERGQGRGAVLTGWVRAGARRPEGVPPRLRVPGAAARLAPSALCLLQSPRRPRAGGGPCSGPASRPRRCPQSPCSPGEEMRGEGEPGSARWCGCEAGAPGRAPSSAASRQCALLQTGWHFNHCVPGHSLFTLFVYSLVSGNKGQHHQLGV